MSLSEVRDILKQIEDRLTAVDVDNPVVEQAVEDLLNLVEHLVASQHDVLQEVQRLKEQLGQKKKAKTTKVDKS